MSPTQAGPERAPREQKHPLYADPARYFYDISHRSTFDEHFIVLNFHTPTTLYGEPDPALHIVRRLDYASDAHLHGALGSRGGGRLPNLAFKVCDPTTIQITGLRAVEASLGLASQREAQSHGAFEEGAEAEVHVSADYDRPVTGAWLASAYQAIFSPLQREDVELDFDPDDYPLT